jgi:hypothetical protein
MSDQHPTIDDPELGTLTRATTELTDGTVLTHDWYGTSLVVDGTEIELILEGTDPREIALLLPRVKDVLARLPALRRVASDAVVTTFSTGEPERFELDAGASDLALDTIEAAADGMIILHLTDECSEHFPEGYWPAVHLGASGDVEQVTVES